MVGQAILEGGGAVAALAQLVQCSHAGASQAAAIALVHLAAGRSAHQKGLLQVTCSLI